MKFVYQYTCYKYCKRINTVVGVSLCGLNTHTHTHKVEFHDIRHPERCVDAFNLTIYSLKIKIALCIRVVFYSVYQKILKVPGSNFSYLSLTNFFSPSCVPSLLYNSSYLLSFAFLTAVFNV